MAPKSLSGKKEECPLEWRWATFCREVHVRMDEPNEVSLIGVTNGFELNVVTGPAGAPEEQLYPVGLHFWLHANFAFKETARTNVPYKISALIQPPNAGSFVKEIDLVRTEGKNFVSINLQVLMQEAGNVMFLKNGENRLRVSFRYLTLAGHKDLGSSEISITTHVTVNENPQLLAMPEVLPRDPDRYIEAEEA